MGLFYCCFEIFLWLSENKEKRNKDKEEKEEEEEKQVEDDEDNEDENDDKVNKQSSSGLVICPTGMANRIHTSIVKNILPKLYKCLVQKVRKTINCKERYILI